MFRQLCPLAIQAVGSATLSLSGWLLSFVQGLHTDLGTIGAVVAVVAGIYSILASRAAIRSHRLADQLNRAKLNELNIQP